jgi:hypothetical protein
VADKCVHGIDSRFCATCRRTANAVPKTNVTEVLLFLNDRKVRATFGAVAEAIGAIPQSMGERLGEHCREASCIVVRHIFGMVRLSLPRTGSKPSPRPL